MALAWSCVQFMGNDVAVLLSDTFHGMPLLEVLAYQSIGVFVGSSLPGVVGGGEVTGDWVCCFDASVVVELRTIVEGNSLESP